VSTAARLGVLPGLQPRTTTQGTKQSNSNALAATGPRQETFNASRIESELVGELMGGNKLTPILLNQSEQKSEMETPAQ
jgi:hypothetical protein